jgi:hypothetical protein
LHPLLTAAATVTPVCSRPRRAMKGRSARGVPTQLPSRTHAPSPPLIPTPTPCSFSLLAFPPSSLPMFRAEHCLRRLPPFGIGTGFASIPNVPRGTLPVPFAAVCFRRPLSPSLRSRCAPRTPFGPGRFPDCAKLECDVGRAEPREKTLEATSTWLNRDFLTMRSQRGLGFIPVRSPGGSRVASASPPPLPQPLPR